MTSHRQETRPSRGSRFRSDIEGLRAIAVIVVLVHHAGLRVPAAGFAGVDIFFVVSGFVITTQLLRELEETGRVRLTTFYARRAKRLLPGATVVLLVTTVAAWLMVSRVQWQAIATDIVGAATYVVNWVFAARAVDYMAEDVAPSPVLHFWSLAVEEQFYIVWPLVIIALAWFASRLRPGAPSRPALALGLTAVIVVPSLVWAMIMTASQPSQAFFVTTTRLWELGIGALVALGAALWMRLPERRAAALAWGGLATICIGLLVQDTTTAWPAPGALVPTLGTAAVIAGGFNAGRLGVGRVLGNSVMVWIGALSYSLYLWHWPVLQIGVWHFGELSPLAGLALVGLAVLPAWLSFRLIESPIRYAPAMNRSSRYALSVGLNCSLVVVIAGLLLQHAVGAGRPIADEGTSLTPAELRGQSDPSRVAGTDDSPLFEVVTPDPVDAVRDAPALYEKGCHVDVYDRGVKECDSGALDSETLIAVVGDSKVAQWMPAIDAIAEENGWRVRIYTKGGCTFTDTMTLVNDDPFEECREWSEEVFERLTEPQRRPDVMITTGLRKAAVDDEGANTVHGLVDGYLSYWTRLSAQGTRVIAVSDTPSPEPSIGPNAYECVAEHESTEVDEACSWDFVEMSSNLAMKEASERTPGAAFIDMNPFVCPDGRCQAVRRNVLTYRQGSHITATYVMALAPALAESLVPLIEEHVNR